MYNKIYNMKLIFKKVKIHEFGAVSYLQGRIAHTKTNIHAQKNPK